MSDTDKQERPAEQVSGPLLTLIDRLEAQVAQLEAERDHERRAVRSLEHVKHERDEARAEVREWLCLKCRTIYSRDALRPGVWCVVCPDEKCKGDIGPRNAMELREARAHIEKFKQVNAGYVKVSYDRLWQIEKLEAALRHGLTRCVQGMHEAAQAEMSRALSTQEETGE